VLFDKSVVHVFVDWKGEFIELLIVGCHKCFGNLFRIL